MTFHRHLTVSLGLAALLAAPAAWADGGYRHGGGHASMSSHGGHGHGTAGGHLLRHLLKHKQELQLSDEQVGKLRTVALDADRTAIRAEADVRVSERELRSLLWDEQAQLPAIEAKVKEQKGFEAAARIATIKARRDLLGVLSPEQRTKLKALWQQRHHGQSRSMSAQGGDVAAPGDGLEANQQGDVELAEALDESSAG